MTTKISVPITAFDEEFLHRLKARFNAHTRIDIQVVEMDEEPFLKETEFWDIISLLDWEAVTREDVLAPAIEALAQRPISHIYQWDDFMAEKLFQLDTAAHAHIAYPGSEDISEDGFLYIRAAVVAKGRKHFEEVLKSPERLNPDEDFEPLLSLAALAYEQKTGRAFDYISPVNYETYSNPAGWA